ncbi:MAG: hypothetical protein Q9228_008046, partial [Teloschistes exilis]
MSYYSPSKAPSTPPRKMISGAGKAKEDDGDGDDDGEDEKTPRALPRLPLQQVTPKASSLARGRGARGGFGDMDMERDRDRDRDMDRDIAVAPLFSGSPVKRRPALEPRGPITKFTTSRDDSPASKPAPPPPLLTGSPVRCRPAFERHGAIVEDDDEVKQEWNALKRRTTFRTPNKPGVHHSSRTVAKEVEKREEEEEEDRKDRVA